MEERVKRKATEIAEEFRSKSGSAISNIFAALLSVIALTTDWLRRVKFQTH